MNRPVGVVIIAVLQLIGSLFGILVGVLIFAFRSFFLQAIADSPEVQASSAITPEMLGTIVSIVAIVILVFSLIGLLLCYGLFQLKAWAWLATLILQGLAAAGNLLSVVASQASDGNPGGIVVQLVINGVIIYYLLRRDVRRSFGQAA